MVIKFKDLEKGKSILFNDNYAIKIDDTRLHVTKLGADGFMEFSPDDEIEIVEDNDV
jgi:hypothetical protein